MSNELEKALDIISNDIKDTQEYIKNRGVYFDHLFDSSDITLKWDGHDKRIWILKSPNPCRLLEASVEIRISVHPILGDFIESINDEIEERMRFICVKAANERISRLLKRKPHNTNRE